VALVLYGPLSLVLAVTLALTFLALQEYRRLASAAYGGRGTGLLLYVLGLLVPLWTYLTGRVYGPLQITFSLLLFLFVASLTHGRHETRLRHAMTEAALKTTALVYICLPLSLFVLLAATHLGRLWILFFLTLIWCNDSFAYLTGKVAGRHKLCPSISPGKTIEGTLGGIASGLVAAIVFNSFACLGPYGTVILGALLVGVLGIAGDLFESVIKRGAGVKDSGTIVPGHGGILDRIDSMLFSLPAIYLLVIGHQI